MRQPVEWGLPTYRLATMIIRDKPSFLELAYTLRGSVVPHIWRQVTGVFILACLVAVLGQRVAGLPAVASPLPYSLLGIALSIFAGFRNSASYERWWEARKVVGQLVIECRNLARLALAYLPKEQGAEAARLSAFFAAAMHAQLRLEPLPARAFELLPAHAHERLASARAPAQRTLALLGECIAAAVRRGDVHPMTAALLEQSVNGLSTVLASAERIRNTPLPFAYSLLLHRTAYLFCFLLPFGLVGSAGVWMPLVCAIVAYTFFGLDALGDELAAPFDRSDNGLPLEAISRNIEIDVLDLCGAHTLPVAMTPQDGVLL